jgi:hypothetical protein
MSILFVVERGSRLKLIGAPSDDCQQLANYFPHPRNYTENGIFGDNSYWQRKRPKRKFANTLCLFQNLV